MYGGSISGFNISECNGVTLNIPPRKKNSQLSEKELIETRPIASLRTHIERAFKKVKVFKILDTIPNNMAGLSSELFFVCAMLTNFGRTVVTDKK